MLFPIVTDGKPLPDDFQTPSKCLKYARESVCIWRVNCIASCHFCKCNKNPNNVKRRQIVE